MCSRKCGIGMIFYFKLKLIASNRSLAYNKQMLYLSMYLSKNIFASSKPHTSKQ